MQHSTLTGSMYGAHTLTAWRPQTRTFVSTAAVQTMKGSSEITMESGKVRTYKGVNLWPAGRNDSGIRWQATVNGRNLRADTLAGIKQLVTEELKLWGSYSR